MKKLLILFAAMFFFQQIQAQKQTFAGKVLDQNKQPLSGASVSVKLSGVGVSTGTDGAFKLDVLPTDELTISMVGYRTKTIKLNKSNTYLMIVLESSVMELGQVVMVGTRSSGRIKTETPVPVDIININQVGTPTAKMDLTSVLNMAAPSFNYNKQTGADGADHIDLGTLRGLGPDQTLVLINGKRRHQTAFVALFGTKGRGNSGCDLNAFPESSVERVEILRDGASAQYGSDAMAGVINMVLRKDINHWSINAGWAGYNDTKYNARKTRADIQYYYGNPIDGNTYSFSANNGLGIGKQGGFINFSLDYMNQGKTFRQLPDTNVQSNPKALPLNTSRRAFGDASAKTYGGMYNMEIPFSTKNKTSFYSFGGINYKSTDAYAYTRNYSARPDRFPVNDNGKLVFIPGIMRTAIDGEIYYNPIIQTHITDVSLAAGIKGKTGSNWNWDFSNTIGRNDFHFFGDQTFNATLVGRSYFNHFDDGGFNFLQNTTNFDINKSISSVAQGLNIGIGTEFRYEKYAIYAGQPESYKGYKNAFGQAPGAQGFPGFSPSDVVKADRNILGGYVDAELNVTKKWLIDVAARLENYSDFGFVITGKVASRYKVAKNFNVRGSFSTGYRAPSLQQINFSNTLTSFSAGQLVQSRVSNNNDPITKAAGIPELKQETSVNGSLGFSWKPVPALTITLDGYIVKVKNRIVLSGLFSADDATLPETLTSQLKNIGVSTAQFFDNGVDTKNKGLDIVIDYNKKFGTDNSLKILLAGNVQKMTVDKVTVPAVLNDSYRHRKTFFSDREEAFLIASAPRAKFSFGVDYTFHKIGVGTHLTYFGNIKSLGFGWTGLASQAGTGGPGDPAISGSFTGIDPYVDIDGFNDQINVVREVFNYRAKITTDVYASYKICKHMSLFAGVDNLFNVHPDLSAVPNARYESFDNESGGPWESVQMGFNGMRLFSKLVFNF